MNGKNETASSVWPSMLRWGSDQPKQGIPAETNRRWFQPSVAQDVFQSGPGKSSTYDAFRFRIYDPSFADLSQTRLHFQLAISGIANQVVRLGRSAKSIFRRISLFGPENNLLEDIHDFHQLDAVLNRFALPEHQESVGSIGDPVTDHITHVDDPFSHVMFGSVNNTSVLTIPVNASTPDLLSLRPFVRSAWVELVGTAQPITATNQIVSTVATPITLAAGAITGATIQADQQLAQFTLASGVADNFFVNANTPRFTTFLSLDLTAETNSDYTTPNLNKIWTIHRMERDAGTNVVTLFSNAPLSAAISTPTGANSVVRYVAQTVPTSVAVQGQKYPVSLDELTFVQGTGYQLNTASGFPVPQMPVAKLVVELASPLHKQHGPAVRTTASNAQLQYHSFVVDLNAFAFFRTQKMAPLSILRAGGFTIALELARPEECLVVPFELNGTSPSVDVRALTMHVRDPQISIWASNYDSIVSSSLQEQIVQAGALQLATTKWTTGHGRLGQNESVITISEPGVSVRGIMVVLLPNPRGNIVSGVNTPRFDPFVSSTGPFASAHLQFMGRQWPSKSMPIIQPNLSLFGPGIGVANLFAYLQQTNGWEFADNLLGIAEQQGNKSFACNVDRMTWAVNHFNFQTGQYAVDDALAPAYCSNYGNFVYAFNLQSYATHGETRGVGWNLGQSLGSDVKLMLQRHPDASTTPEVDYVYFVLSDAVAIYQADGTCKLAV